MRNLLIVTACLLFSGVALAQPVLYSCGSEDDQLRTINTADGSTTSSIAITIPGGSVHSCTGLATDPVSQLLHAIIKFTDDGSASFDRGLATIDPSTGFATVIGNFNTGFAGLAFSCDALYGVTGDGGTPSETLHTVSTTDASVTSVLTLGQGSDGETIAFNPVDGLMYHGSGHSGACSGADEGVCFESIDLDSLVVTNIDISGGALIDEEAQAMTWWAAQGVFLWKQDHSSNAPLFQLTTGGSETLIGDLDHKAKGLAFVPVDYSAAGCGSVGVPGEQVPVPVNNKWALAALLALMLIVGVGYLRKRKTAL